MALRLNLFRAGIGFAHCHKWYGHHGSIKRTLRLVEYQYRAQIAGGRAVASSLPSRRKHMPQVLLDMLSTRRTALTARRHVPLAAELERCIDPGMSKKNRNLHLASHDSSADVVQLKSMHLPPLLSYPTGESSDAASSPRTNDAQRIRLDRAREASHDLNRLLDEPGRGAAEPPEDIYCGNMPLWSATAARLQFQSRPGGCCVSRRAFQAPKAANPGPIDASHCLSLRALMPRHRQRERRPTWSERRRGDNRNRFAPTKQRRQPCSDDPHHGAAAGAQQRRPWPKRRRRPART